MKITKKILGMICLTAFFYIMFMQAEHYLSKDLTIYEKIAEGKPYNYLIIGDSIGRGAGAEKKQSRWFNQLESLIKDYSGSKGRRNMVVQSGSTAFEGIYKLQHAPKPRDIDLIFIVFGENDRKYMEADQFAYFYEKLIRDAKDTYRDAEIITIIESPLKQEEFAEEIKRISVHYAAKYLDMRIPFKESGMLTEQLTADMIHPNGKGYRLYANAVFNLIADQVENGAEVANFPKPLTSRESYFLAEQKSISVNNGFRLENGYYVGRSPGNYLEYEFQGPILGINVTRSEMGGMMKVYIDGEYMTTMSTWWPFVCERHLYITSGLEDRPHVVRFEMIKDVSARNTSRKSLLQISSIIVAKEKDN